MYFTSGYVGCKKGFGGDDKKDKELFDWKSSLYIYVIRNGMMEIQKFH